MARSRPCPDCQLLDQRATTPRRRSERPRLCPARRRQPLGARVTVTTRPPHSLHFLRYSPILSKQSARPREVRACSREQMALAKGVGAASTPRARARVHRSAHQHTRLDFAAGRKCCDSCDKRLPLAAFKEDSDGGGLPPARQPSQNACRSVGCSRPTVAYRRD
jgi:hypothetical protein